MADVHAKLPKRSCPSKRSPGAVEEVLDVPTDPKTVRRIAAREPVTEATVAYRTKKWGISKEQLAAAVEKAGVSADAVARELGKA